MLSKNTLELLKTLGGIAAILLLARLKVISAFTLTGDAQQLLPQLKKDAPEVDNQANQTAVAVPVESKEG